MIPVALRKHLDRLGATVTPVDRFTTKVHVPGGSHDVEFHAGGRKVGDGEVRTSPAVTLTDRQTRTSYPDPQLTWRYDRLLGRPEQHPDNANDVHVILEHAARSGPWLADHPAGNGRRLSMSQELTPDGRLRHRVVLYNDRTGVAQPYDSEPVNDDRQLHPAVADLLKSALQVDPGSEAPLFDAMEEYHDAPDHYARHYAAVAR